LEKRDRLLVTGGEGSGKSTLVRQLAILSAAGLHPFNFTPTPPVNVLVIDAENSESQWRRASRGVTKQAKLYGSHDPGDLRISCTPRMDLTRDSDLGQVHRLLDDAMADIVVIGPLYRLVPRAITNDDEASPLLAALDTIRDRGCALVIEAHAGHALGQGGERDLRPRGSAALMGWPEFGLGLRLPKPGTTTYEITRWRGDRDRRDFPNGLVKGGDWPWTPVI
jgi:replicative DNA helicase